MGWSVGFGARLEPTAWNLTSVSRSSSAWRSGYTDRFPTGSIGNLFLYEIRWFCRTDTHFCICDLDVCRHEPEDRFCVVPLSVQDQLCQLNIRLSCSLNFEGGVFLWIKIYRNYTLVWESVHYWDTRSVGILRNVELYEGWNFNSGNYLFTTDTK